MARALALLALASCLAILLVGPADATTCAPQNCPSGYDVTAIPNIFNPDSQTTVGTCAYTCTRPANLNCFPRFPRTMNPKLYDAALALTGPYVCGGTSYDGDAGRPCPTVACGSVSTYSVSGSGGCAVAKANLDVLAISETALNTSTNFDAIFKQYCYDGAVEENALAAFAAAAANATAKQVVKTLIHYSTYMCQCACGTLSSNYVVIKADVQSVATAVAKAFVGAIAAVADCYDNTLEFASMYSDAIAVAVETAVDNVNKKFVNRVKGYESCTVVGVQTQVETAVAEALVCVYAEAFAAAANGKTHVPGVTGVAYSCGTAISIAGSYVGKIGDKLCPLKFCDCSPKAQGYNNTGFETGKFNGNGYNGYKVFPEWTVQYNEKAPVILSSDYVITSLFGGVTIKPSEGHKFAKIWGTDNTSPTGTNSITTTISVPPCASKVLIDWIFDCNDFTGDNGRVSITATNIVTGEVLSAKVEPACPQFAKGGLSNNGHWSTLSLSIPTGATGEYSVVVKAEEKNDNDGWFSTRSNLYVDNLRYAP